MTTLIEAQTVIETRMRDNYQAATGLPQVVPILFEGVDGLLPAAPPYVKFFIRYEPSDQSGFGSTGELTYRRFGHIVVQCFTSKGIGVTDARWLADAVAKVFEGRRLGDICFREASITEVGSDKGLYQVNCRVFFDYDETRAVVA